jgi:hypothetical protein
MKNVKTSVQEPSAFVTKNKQRLKQFTDTVYLKNGDEFEIELFNPTLNKILAKIEINGTQMCSGIVLRPGERVYLERFLNTPKKFVFETYEVNGKSDVVKQAIKNNGTINVKFYNEFINLYNGITYYPSWTYTPPLTYTTYLYNQNKNYDLNSLIVGTTSTGTANSYGITAGTTNSYTSTTNCFYGSNTADSYVPPKTETKIETGRVEKGSDSNQSFQYNNSSFYSYEMKSITWNIKPLSTKPVHKEDLVTFCTNCGSKRKKDSFKFCPHCGSKF